MSFVSNAIKNKKDLLFIGSLHIFIFVNNSKIALASIAPAGEMKSSLGCQPLECWSARPSMPQSRVYIPKSRIFQSRLSFIQLTTITQSESAHWRLFVISYTHTQAAERCKVWPWIPNVCTAREKASAWQNF